MKWPNNRSINFLFKYKMNYINYYIIKTVVKLKDTVLHKYCKNLYFYIIIIVTIKELHYNFAMFVEYCKHITDILQTYC